MASDEQIERLIKVAQELTEQLKLRFMLDTATVTCVDGETTIYSDGLSKILATTKLQDAKPCAYPGCEEQGTQLAWGNDGYIDQPPPPPAMYCKSHAQLIAERSGDVCFKCPNCGCLLGHGCTDSVME